ncbi:beta-ketoacyl synthase [Solitalea longa]|uniref:Beta-ketoacyl synthase n=1 Tax=Solitalea longa TaxID=2079460 RepID=A0A2S5A1Z2_9SPHI|nr:beta-ketoacyl synthase N-terminal-like domain-containing protein [Solitalea longa]POY36544.1 beta-ketoacyl synthase [Solitalea longa]
MARVFVVADNMLTPMGSTSFQNFEGMKAGINGVRIHDNPTLSNVPFCASVFSDQSLFNLPNYTKFEQLLINSIQEAVSKTTISLNDPETILILSSTKGNISLVETEPYTHELRKRISLHHSAALVADHFNAINKPVVVSNACISGLAAMLVAKRLIDSGRYKNAIVAGADVISRFVLSGFQSFQAVSESLCKPFDQNRKGINLGEGAATIILTSNPKHIHDQEQIVLEAGAISNDANHISGPSRTGEELNIAIQRSMQMAGIKAEDIDWISTHGTATIYNDEMEAKAIALAQLQHKPLNSLKGFFGHTLGAAGLLESVAGIYSLKTNTILPTPGFETLGVSASVNVIKEPVQMPLNRFLKTASGFGGCNAALIFSKQR